MVLPLQPFSHKQLLRKGFEFVNEGTNPIYLKRGMDKAVKVVVEELQKQAVVVGSDREKIKQVATISANNDSIYW
jgi:chaperonin GroEL